MKKLIIPISIIIAAIILGASFYLIEINESSNENKVAMTTPNEYWRISQGEYSNNTVCDLKVSGVVKFQDEQISTESNVDINSTKLTFVDLNSDSPYMIGNMGDKVELIKIDSGNIIYLLEHTSLGYINVFTLFRDKNIMIMSKQYELLDFPFGLIMMGDCLAGF